MSRCYDCALHGGGKRAIFASVFSVSVVLRDSIMNDAGRNIEQSKFSFSRKLTPELSSRIKAGRSFLIINESNVSPPHESEIYSSFSKLLQRQGSGWLAFWKDVFPRQLRKFEAAIPPLITVTRITLQPYTLQPYLACRRDAASSARSGV